MTLEPKPHKKPSSRLYKWVADGIANNLFSLIYGFNEYFVAGMTLPQVGRARATAAVGNMLTGGMYGEWQEYLSRRLGITKSSHWFKKYAADVAAFATGQSPIYALYLIASTAGWKSIEALYNANMHDLVQAWKDTNWSGMGQGVVFLTVVAPALATPQRWVYDQVRKVFGLEEILAHTNK